jgi:hypothetical protein
VVTLRNGERIRLTHSLKRAHTVLDQLEIALRMPGPIGAEASSALMSAAIDISNQIAKHDAYLRAEELAGLPEDGDGVK